MDTIETKTPLPQSRKRLDRLTGSPCALASGIGAIAQRLSLIHI